MPRPKPKPKRSMPSSSGKTTTARGSKRPGHGIRITEDHPLWNWRTMGNKRRGPTSRSR